MKCSVNEVKLNHISSFIVYFICKRISLFMEEFSILFNPMPQQTMSFLSCLMRLQAVVISRGAQVGRAPFVNIVVHFEGLSPPKFLHQSCFLKRIDLASNVLYGIAMMNFLTAIWLFRSL